MIASRRQLIARTAGLGSLVIAAAVIAYVLFVAVVGTSWTEVPEGPPGTPVDPTIVLRPTPIQPVLIAFATASLAVGGIVARLRRHRWGLYVASIGAVGLTIFGAFFIFGSFGLTFIAGVALLAFLAVFAWFGRNTDADTD